MSGFKRKVERDIHKVFLNPKHFADLRTVKYDSEDFVDIPIVLTGAREHDRRRIVMQQGQRDHAQGLFMVSRVLQCAISDLGGKQPEKGQRIQINNQEGGGGFFFEYTVASSICEMGMLTVELEAIDE